MIDGLIVERIDTFQDHRGLIYTVHDDGDFGSAKFSQDRISTNRKGVFRGLHGDAKISKLIMCLHGTLQLVVIDARKDSSTRGNVFDTILDWQRPSRILVPAGCLNGHLALTEDTVFFYKWSHAYEGPEVQSTIRWDNPMLKGVKWAIDGPFGLSERDKKDFNFEDIKL